MSNTPPNIPTPLAIEAEINGLRKRIAYNEVELADDRARLSELEEQLNELKENQQQ